MREQEPFGLGGEGVKPPVSNGAGWSPDSSSTIFGGGGGGGKLSSVFLPATSMGVVDKRRACRS